MGRAWCGCYRSPCGSRVAEIPSFTFLFGHGGRSDERTGRGQAAWDSLPTGLTGQCGSGAPIPPGFPLAARFPAPPAVRRRRGRRCAARARAPRSPRATARCARAAPRRMPDSAKSSTSVPSRPSACARTPAPPGRRSAARSCGHVARAPRGRCARRLASERDLVRPGAPPAPRHAPACRASASVAAHVAGAHAASRYGVARAGQQRRRADVHDVVDAAREVDAEERQRRVGHGVDQRAHELRGARAPARRRRRGRARSAARPARRRRRRAGPTRRRRRRSAAGLERARSPPPASLPPRRDAHAHAGALRRARRAPRRRSRSARRARAARAPAPRATCAKSDDAGVRRRAAPPARGRPARPPAISCARQAPRAHPVRGGAALELVEPRELALRRRRRSSLPQRPVRDARAARRRRSSSRAPSAQSRAFSEPGA